MLRILRQRVAFWRSIFVRSVLHDDECRLLLNLLATEDALYHVQRLLLRPQNRQEDGKRIVSMGNPQAERIDGALENSSKQIKLAAVEELPFYASHKTTARFWTVQTFVKCGKCLLKRVKHDKDTVANGFVRVVVDVVF